VKIIFFFSFTVNAFLMYCCKTQTAVIKFPQPANYNTVPAFAAAEADCKIFAVSVSDNLYF
jgi:hypothetical protein